jgi:hypothetical protein
MALNEQRLDNRASELRISEGTQLVRGADGDEDWSLRLAICVCRQTTIARWRTPEHGVDTARSGTPRNDGQTLMRRVQAAVR